MTREQEIEDYRGAYFRYVAEEHDLSYEWMLQPLSTTELDLETLPPTAASRPLLPIGKTPSGIVNGRASHESHN